MVNSEFCTPTTSICNSMLSVVRQLYLGRFLWYLGYFLCCCYTYIKHGHCKDLTNDGGDFKKCAISSISMVVGALEVISRIYHTLLWQICTASRLLWDYICERIK